MAKLVISNGSFTTLLVSNILELDNNNVYFIGYFKNISYDLHLQHYQFAKSLFPYYKFINLYMFNYKLPNKQILVEETEQEEITDIYISINSTSKKWYKKFKKIYPTANFHFYEEGLMSYIKVLFDPFLRRIMQQSKNYYLLYNDSFVKLFSEYLKGIEITPICLNTLKDKIKSFDPKGNMVNKSFKEKKHQTNALILPQYYYQNSKRKTKQLIQMYTENASFLIKNGYTVFFKEHPKAKLSYFLEIKKELLKNNVDNKNFILLEDLSIYPIELFIEKLNISLVFSVYSSSLFTCKLLFGTKCFTSTEMLNHRINITSLYPTISAVFTQNLINDLKSSLFKDTKEETVVDLFNTHKLILILYIKMIKFLMWN